MPSDILPTGLECGVQNGCVQPGCTVAIVGSGPIGLTALLTAKFYSPSAIIMIDLRESAAIMLRAQSQQRKRNPKMSYFRCKLGRSLAVMVVVLAGSFNVAQAADKKPNILVIWTCRRPRSVCAWRFPAISPRSGGIICNCLRQRTSRCRRVHRALRPTGIRVSTCSTRSYTRCRYPCSRPHQ